MNDREAEVVREEPAPTSLAEFLEGTAPGNPRDVADLAEERHHRDHGFIGYCFVAPDIQKVEAELNRALSHLLNRESD